MTKDQQDRIEAAASYLARAILHIQWSSRMTTSSAQQVARAIYDIKETPGYGARQLLDAIKNVTWRGNTSAYALSQLDIARKALEAVIAEVDKR